MSLTQGATAYIQEHFERFLKELQAYARIPSVSAPGFLKEPMEAAAQWTAQRMQQAGLYNIELLRVPDAPPFVYGEWLKAPGKPTVLLYAHYDVQPPGRESYWQSPPFEPQIRQGRLYGRGTADDKAGGMMHLAAIEAYLQTGGELPVNIRFIIEGEEEVGSEHLQAFLKLYQARLQADVMVLTDTANLDVGLPSITYRLRGLVDAIVEVRTLDHPVHSGMWGGPVMDALTALNQILSRLITRDGKIAIPHFYDAVALLSKTEREQLQHLPFADQKFRQEVGAVPSLQWAGDPQKSVYEKIWCEPALAILGIDAPSVASTSNKIVEWASAKISIRIVNDQDPEKMLKLLCDFLQQDPPFGCEVKVTPGAAGDPWKGDIEAPAFKAAQTALAKGYGREPVFVGCGGSIPFVKPLTTVFPNMPALLIGVEDPYTNAHGENESLHIEDWKKGILSAVYLYRELS